jgi:arylsulfatase A-like enzyme
MFLDEADAERGIQDGETTYVSRLKALGYQTALVGKWHLGHGRPQFWPTRHGFDSFFGHTGGCVDFFTLQYGNRPDWYRGNELVPTQGYATDVITDEAIAIVKSARDSNKPFYLHVSYNAPHFGKGWNEKDGATENVMQPKPDDLERVRSIEDPLRRAFAAKVVGMDDSIGRLLEVLADLEMDDTTLVIFMTDHGGDPVYGGSNQPLRGGKATLFEGGIRVPCIVRWPGKVAAGSVSDAVACSIDWFDTLIEIATGKTTPESLGVGPSRDGRSILPELLGQSSGGPRTLVWRTGAHQLLDRRSWRAVRQGNWKWVQPPGEEGMLFDLSNDPCETNDLATDRPAVAAELMMVAND